MKKICVLLALLFLLTACAAPAGTPASSAAESVSSQLASTAETSLVLSSAESSEVSSGVSSEESSTVTSVEEVTSLPETASSQAPEITSSERIELPSSSAEEVSSEAPPSSSGEEHSPLYIEGLSVEDVILYFNEVCLDAEYSGGGDFTVVQKWQAPIIYKLYGEYTAEDAELIKSFAAMLNEIEGFPGLCERSDDSYPSLRISFLDQEGLEYEMGSVVNYEAVDGAVEYWYDGENQIYDARIGIRCDVDQYLRNSVILEEIYNGLGPIQDTWYREDSIAYAGYSEPQWLTEVDVLLLKLLYHPEMRCGMDAAACEEVIRGLYY